MSKRKTKKRRKEEKEEKQGWKDREEGWEREKYFVIKPGRNFFFPLELWKIQRSRLPDGNKDEHGQNDLKRKKNGGQEEKKEGKKRRKGDDFFFKVLEVCQKLGSQPEFLVTGKFPSICLSILTNAVKTAGLDVRT
jgi:hypothetical protein